MSEFDKSLIFGNILKPINKSSISISFVNNSLSSKSFSSSCSSFSRNMEKTAYGESFRLMNKGYRRLSEIAWHVSSKESAFYLIGQAYGSIKYFFKLVENQRKDLETYGHACLYKGNYLKGLVIILVCKMAIKWYYKFLNEYKSLKMELW